MKQMKLMLLLSFAFAFVSCHPLKHAPQEKNIDPVHASMSRNAAIFLSDTSIHAVSIGIYKDGKKYTGHYGELDRGKANTPTDKTIYEIASVSKTLTGVLVAKAVLEDRLRLEEDIRTYLEEDFPNFQYKGYPVKVKHLVTHTSGLPAFLPESINDLLTEFNESLPFKMSAIQEQYSREAFFRDLHQIKLDTIPGAVYSYSNVDAELMAHILERVYQVPFEELLQRYFSKTARMTNTKIILAEKDKANLANGYGMTGKLVPHEPTTLYGAEGGVKATMPDLVNYMEFQMDSTNKVVVESQKVLYVNGNRRLAYYWPVKSNDDFGNYFSHHGGAFGSQNWFFILPEHNLGISVVTNQSDLNTPEKLMKTVKSLIHDLK